MDASQLETLLRAYCRGSEAAGTRPKLDFTSGKRASLLDSESRRSRNSSNDFGFSSRPYCPALILGRQELFGVRFRDAGVVMG
jgi:hypothetical protein